MDGSQFDDEGKHNKRKRIGLELSQQKIWADRGPDDRIDMKLGFEKHPEHGPQPTLHVLMQMDQSRPFVIRAWSCQLTFPGMNLKTKPSMLFWSPAKGRFGRCQHR